jgi:hypothetical protein
MTAATPAAETRSNGVAVAGFVCGLIGAIFSIIPLFVFIFPGILDILGIVFGIRGRRNAAAGARQGGLATAGLILGIIGLLLFILWWVLVAVGAREQ